MRKITPNEKKWDFTKWGVIPNGEKMNIFFDENELGKKIDPLNIDLSTWDGKDFLINLVHAVSEKLKKILEKHKIENVIFTPLIEGENYRYING